MTFAFRSLCMGTVMLVTTAVAQTPPSTPDAGRDSCIDAGCHAKQITGTLVHQPTADGACDFCHEPASEVGHQFNLSADPIGEVCTACHEDPTAGRANVHAALGDGECTNCHDPHASTAASLLIDPANELCLGCHGDLEESLTMTSVHEPILNPGCIGCHDPHATTHPTLLLAVGNEVCMECHSPDRRSADAKSGEIELFGSHPVSPEYFDLVPQITLTKDKRGHPLVGHPVEGASDPSHPERTFGCISCHAPHGSGRRALLNGPAGYRFCRQCHSK